MPEVIYRNIQGFDGYRIGSDGSVWSCWDKETLGFGKGSRSFIGTRWHKRKLSVNKCNGYLQVMLSKDKKKYMMYVHHLVLEAFVGSAPKDMQACHFPDRSRTNCNLENLRWDTCSANHADMKKHGTETSGDRHYSRTRPERVPRGEKHHAAKIDSGVVIEIRQWASFGLCNTVIGHQVGLTEAQVRRIVRGEAWKHV